MLDQPTKQLWYGTKGRPDAPIVFIGESWGSDEARVHKPFVGFSGQELDRILLQAGVPHDKILFTNTIAAQPLGNETWRFFEPKCTFTGTRIGGLAPSALAQSELTRLYQQILSYPRALIIAAGNYALWACSQITSSKVQAQSNNRLIPQPLQTWSPGGILDWRGSMCYAEPHQEFFSPGMQRSDWAGMQLLPLVHPAAIMRAWYLRDPTIHDLRKRVPLALRHDWRPQYDFWAPPSYRQVQEKLREWLSKADSGTRVRLACDIETARTLITCLGLADSATFAMSIPFIRRVADAGFDSWFTPEEEAQIVHLLRCLLTHPGIELDGQNFIYDTQYIQRYLGVTPHLDHDTMLHQNVCFPGTPKALEYLSSLYCHYHWFWKEDHKEWDMKGDVEQLLRYNCMDCVRTWEIGQNQREVTRHLGLEEQFQFKMRTNELCLRMMNRGVRFDGKRRGQLLHELQEAGAQLQRELLSIIPQEWIAPVGKRSKSAGGGSIFWTTSDKQQKYLFYELLGFKAVRDPKTGNLTSGKKALGQFRLRHPEFTGLLDRLEDFNSIENTVTVLKSTIDSDGRMRCSYNPGGAETHRLSSSENAFGGGTNLQNLTKGDEDE
jgi:uracil-DNA glycosylase